MYFCPVQIQICEAMKDKKWLKIVLKIIAYAIGLILAGFGITEAVDAIKVLFG